jgi:hypothetical protein
MMLDLIEMLEAQQHMGMMSVPPQKSTMQQLTRQRDLRLQAKAHQLRVGMFLSNFWKQKFESVQGPVNHPHSLSALKAPYLSVLVYLTENDLTTSPLVVQHRLSTCCQDLTILFTLLILSYASNSHQEY